jgi:hypothetical protein
MAATLVSAGWLVISPVDALAQTVGATISVVTIRGAYATGTTEGVVLFSGVDAQAGPLRLAVSIPLSRMTTSPLATVPGGAVPGSSSTAGAGDPLVRADLRVVDDTRRGFQVSAAGAVKYAMVDEASGRGSGEHDLGAGGSVFLMRGRTSLMADAMFWRYGDPDGIDYRDGVSYSVGVGRLVGAGRWSVLGTLAGFSAGLDDSTPPVSLGVSLLGAFLNGHSVAVSTGVGLTSGASDVSVGVSWRVSRALGVRTSASVNP